jgi:alkylation response protein AidB-like acyl-CoA dehydrogenase
VNLDIPDEVIEFGKTARDALSDSIALDRARAAMNGDAEARRGVIAILARLGIHEFDLTSHHDALAASHLCRELGRIGGIAPVASMLTASAAGRDGIVQSVATTSDRFLVDHADLFEMISVVDIDGSIHEATIELVASSRHLLAPFAATCRHQRTEAGSPWLWAFHETMVAFTSLGAIEAALDLSREHLEQRHQFGKPLGTFQALQHRFADISLAAAGLSELAHYTLWALYRSPGQAVTDSLALRAYQLESTRSVFRNAHQIHAAIGLTDEHALSLLSRSVQFSRFVPFPIDETLTRLNARLSDGFDAIFPIGRSAEHPIDR